MITKPKKLSFDQAELCSEWIIKEEETDAYPLLLIFIIDDYAKDGGPEEV